LGYFTLNKTIKCVSYRLSKPRLNFLSLVFGQCTLSSLMYFLFSPQNTFSTINVIYTIGGGLKKLKIKTCPEIL
jgi:hypothetical protein